MPSWIGPWEIVIIVVIIVLIFGGRLIPKLGSSLGKSVVGLKKGLKEGEEGFKDAIKEDKAEAGTTSNAEAAPTETKKSDQS